jgi:hypothetical protein
LGRPERRAYRYGALGGSLQQQLKEAALETAATQQGVMVWSASSSP